MANSDIRALLADAQTQLAQAGVDSPRFDAQVLLAQILGVSRADLVVRDSVTDEQQVSFRDAVARRARREPLQHITGEAWFRHLTLAVGPGVFIPRPETETLVELALEFVTQLRAQVADRRFSVVDLCTGSAAIPLALATEATMVDAVAVELSSEAMAWAQLNVREYESKLFAATSTVRLVEYDATQVGVALAELGGRVDIVTSNPPYIPDAGIPRDPEVRDFDPSVALFGGADGLDVVRGVVAQAADLLIGGGLVLVEHGDEQGDRAGSRGVPAVLTESGDFDQVQDHLDLTGRPRVTTARRRHR